ncbi:MAG TPA: acyltransferase family protein [Acidisarcina sp.]
MTNIIQNGSPGIPAADTNVRPAGGSKKHRKDIDGLRAIAILSVLGYHCGLPGFSGGFVGVDVFFAISGYLICGIIVREIKQERFSLKRFYERRCKRILPALFVVLLFTLAMAALVLSPYEARHVGDGVMATVLSISNVDYYLQGNYFRGTLQNPLVMTWSLAVEEQFYIVFPMLMVLLYKGSKRHLFAALAALCTLSLLLSIYMEYHHPEFNFYLPFTRAWEIGAGAMLALWEATRAPRQAVASSKVLINPVSAAGLIIILASVIFYSPRTRFPGYEAIPPVLGTILLLGLAEGVASKILALRPFVAVGLISYSLYLWHWPLLSFASIIGPAVTPMKIRLVLMLFAFGAATLSYFFVEGPFRSRRYPNTNKVLLSYASVIVCFFLVGAAFYWTRGLPIRCPQLARIEQTVEIDREHPCLVMPNTSAFAPGCLLPVSPTPAIALLGDSHADALEPELRKYATEHGYKLLALTKTVCAPMQGVTRIRFDLPQHAELCRQFNQRAVALVASRPDVKLVFLTGSWAFVEQDRFMPVGYHGSPSTISQQQSEVFLLQGITAEIRALEAAGKQVVLMDDVPSLNVNPLQRYRYMLLPFRRALANLLGEPRQDPSVPSVSRSENISPEAEAARRSFLQLAKTDPNLMLIDSKAILCTATECSFSDGAHLYYSDNNHLSPFGAAMLVSHLGLESDPKNNSKQ